MHHQGADPLMMQLFCFFFFCLFRHFQVFEVKIANFAFHAVAL